MGTGTSFSGDKAAEAWSWSRSFTYCRDQESLLQTWNYIRVGYTVVEVSLGQVFLPVLQFPQQIMIPRMLRTYLSPLLTRATGPIRRQMITNLDQTSPMSWQKHKLSYTYCFRSRDNSVGLVTGDGLDGPGSIPGSSRYFFPPEHPDRLWGLPSLQSNE
jgi:hypothetical protein